jgi:hypothetical protein
MVLVSMFMAVVAVPSFVHACSFIMRSAFVSRQNLPWIGWIHNQWSMYTASILWFENEETKFKYDVNLSIKLSY